MPKVEGKHLMFKASVAGIKTRLLTDNGSKAKLIDKSLVRTQRIHTFKLKKQIKLTLGNGEVVQKLDSACLIDVHIGDHHEQILCYVAHFDVYSMVLGDGWLQTHNSAIDSKNRCMKFNSAACMESGCLARGVPCVEFAIGSKAKNRIGTEKLTAVEPGDIDIKPVNAKHFFRMACQKDHEGYIWIPRVLSTDCTSKECSSSSHVAKWCVNTTKVAEEDYGKFIKDKPEYTKEDLLKRVPSEYHSIIDVFMKSNANIVAKHRADWDHEIHLEESQKVFFVRNYKSLSDQETAARKKYIDKHLGKGFIQPSLSAAASPILLVRKPGGGLRFCIDYRALNAMTVKNRYLIPLISEMLGKLAASVRYTKLDVIHTFNQIRMKEGHKWLTAFNSRYGQFEYLVMPFGLCNAPGTFQGYINESLREYLDVFCTAYLDDVLIYSAKELDHADHVLQVLKRLHQRGLHIDIDKCEFNTRRVKYLGIIVTTDGIEMVTEKVDVI